MWEAWRGKRLHSPPWSRAFGALKFSHCDFRPVSSNVLGHVSQWGLLIPVPGLSCRCLEPFPQQASALCGFLAPVPPSLLLTLPAPHAPSCSLRSGFPVTANNVLIHSVAGIWRRGESLGAEEEEERQRSECACPGPAVQLWLKVLCGALWLSASPVSYGNESCCTPVVCPPALL